MKVKSERNSVISINLKNEVLLPMTTSKKTSTNKEVEACIKYAKKLKRNRLYFSHRENGEIDTAADTVNDYFSRTENNSIEIDNNNLNLALTINKSMEKEGRNHKISLDSRQNSSNEGYLTQNAMTVTNQIPTTVSKFISRKYLSFFSGHQMKNPSDKNTQTEGKTFSPLNLKKSTKHNHFQQADLITKDDYRRKKAIFLSPKPKHVFTLQNEDKGSNVKVNNLKYSYNQLSKPNTVEQNNVITVNSLLNQFKEANFKPLNSSEGSFEFIESDYTKEELELLKTNFKKNIKDALYGHLKKQDTHFFSPVKAKKNLVYKEIQPNNSLNNVLEKLYRKIYYLNEKNLDIPHEKILKVLKKDKDVEKLINNTEVSVNKDKVVQTKEESKKLIISPKVLKLNHSSSNYSSKLNTKINSLNTSNTKPNASQTSIFRNTTSGNSNNTSKVYNLVSSGESKPTSSTTRKSLNIVPDNVFKEKKLNLDLGIFRNYKELTIHSPDLDDNQVKQNESIAEVADLASPTIDYLYSEEYERKSKESEENSSSGRFLSSKKEKANNESEKHSLFSSKIVPTLTQTQKTDIKRKSSKKLSVKKSIKIQKSLNSKIEAEKVSKEILILDLSSNPEAISNDKTKETETHQSKEKKRNSVVDVFQDNIPERSKEKKPSKKQAKNKLGPRLSVSNESTTKTTKPLKKEKIEKLIEENFVIMEDKSENLITGRKKTSESILMNNSITRKNSIENSSNVKVDIVESKSPISVHSPILTAKLDSSQKSPTIQSPIKTDSKNVSPNKLSRASDKKLETVNISLSNQDKLEYFKRMISRENDIEEVSFDQDQEDQENREKTNLNDNNDKENMFSITKEFNNNFMNQWLKFSKSDKKYHSTFQLPHNSFHNLLNQKDKGNNPLNSGKKLLSFLSKQTKEESIKDTQKENTKNLQSQHRETQKITKKETVLFRRDFEETTNMTGNQSPEAKSPLKKTQEQEAIKEVDLIADTPEERLMKMRRNAKRRNTRKSELLRSIFRNDEEIENFSSNNFKELQKELDYIKQFDVGKFVAKVEKESQHTEHEKEILKDKEEWEKRINFFLTNQHHVTEFKQIIKDNKVANLRVLKTTFKKGPFYE